MHRRKAGSALERHIFGGELSKITGFLAYKIPEF